MKKRIIEISISFIIITILTAVIPVSAVYANPTHQEISRLQLEGQVKLFKKTLDNFGAKDYMEAVNLYILGYKERNGVYQYSVLCDNLKQEFIKQMGEPSKSFWIIGGSSPWLEDSKILETKKINDETYKVKIQLHWHAFGYDDYEEKTLTLAKQGNKWCITNTSALH